MNIVVAGVCGTGKSTIGKGLSEHLDIPFIDADDFHPQSNIDKMSKGQALNDADRQPWLEELSSLLVKNSKSQGSVLACSALKASYRDILSANAGLDIKWIILSGTYDLLAQRLSNREDHFLDNNSILESQLATLELPDYGICIDVSHSIDDIINQAITYIEKDT